MNYPRLNLIEVGRLWRQGMDTYAIARVLQCGEADVEKNLNRLLDKEWEIKNGE